MDDVGFGSCASQIIYDRILKSLAVGADDEARPRARQQLFVNLFLLKKKEKKERYTILSIVQQFPHVRAALKKRRFTRFAPHRTALATLQYVVGGPSRARYKGRHGGGEG